MLPRANSSRTLLISLTAGLIAWLAQSQTAVAQYSKVATPLINVNDSFFENFGLGFGFGIAGGNGGLNLVAAQGSNRSMVMQSPTVVVPNGGTGTFVDVRQTPFVTGLIPIVGLQPPPAVTPLQDKLSRLSPSEIQSLGRSTNSSDVSRNEGYEDRRRGEPVGPPSSASHGDISVADILAQQSAEDARTDGELQSLIARAREAEAAGKPNVARIYYNMAIRRATGQKKAELKSKVQELLDGSGAAR